MTRRNDPELVARVQRMRATGASYRDVAQACNVSESTVRNWTKGAPPVGAAQPPPPPGEPRALPDELASLAAELDGADAHAEADVCRRAAAALRARPEAPPAAEDAPDPVENPVGYIAHLIQSTERMKREAEEVGNFSKATQLASTIQKLMPTLRQMQRAEDDERGLAVALTQAQLDVAEKRWRDNMAILQSRPLVCDECGVKLRMRAAGVESE